MMGVDREHYHARLTLMRFRVKTADTGPNVRILRLNCTFTVEVVLRVNMSVCLHFFTLSKFKFMYELNIQQETAEQYMQKKRKLS
jgi:hypothetical protein